MNQQKQKKSGFPWALLIILIPLLLRVRDGELSPALFGVVILAIVFAIVFSAVAGKKNGKAAEKQSRPAAAPARKTPEVELHRPVPSMQRREPVTAQRNFSQPDAYCVSCELSGEDHFARDRRRRLQQLDEWLKNGLVDKQEYLVLKQRFERDQ